MAGEPKTRPTNVDPRVFLAGVADPKRRSDALELLDEMQVLSGYAPQMWGDAIVGYGRYTYAYAKGQALEWPRLGFSPRKQDLTLYLMAEFDRRTELLARLGRHRTGKVCLYLKRLADVDREVLRELIRASLVAMDQRYPDASR